VDAALIVILSAATLMLLMLVVLILTGYGDGLMAGYNTAKEKDRQQYDTKRLRAVLAALLLLTVAYLWCVPLIGAPVVVTVLWTLLFVAGIIIANTWCKKS
jgi:hypothetical protein